MEKVVFVSALPESSSGTWARIWRRPSCRPKRAETEGARPTARRSRRRRWRTGPGVSSGQPGRPCVHKYGHVRIQNRAILRGFTSCTPRSFQNRVISNYAYWLRNRLTLSRWKNPRINININTKINCDMYTSKKFLYLFCLPNYGIFRSKRSAIYCTQQGPSSDLEYVNEKQNKTKYF